MTTRIIMTGLGFLGLIPFAAGAWLTVVGGMELLPGLGLEPGFLFASYSAIILSFLGGVLWGRSLALETTSLGRNLLLLSNGVALLAWFSLLAGPEYLNLALLTLMLGYVAVFSAEHRLAVHADYELLAPYMRMRLFLTNLVLVAHLLVLAFG
jgi:hypothetical protein